MPASIALSRGSLFTFTCIFALSGFSGLIYQSIWSHYLKLFLGHSSYAQILVLGIFMGGMAIGAAIAAKKSLKATNLVLWYGICEGIIGLFGVTFHWLFVNVEFFAFSALFPMFESSSTVHAAKWTIGALLILPQSILLGATFPLLATGLLRKFSGNSGKTLATLYFVNSLGAAIGILANAFILIPSIGLPGSILTAGLINILIAVVVYYLSKTDNYPAKPPQQSNTSAIKYLPLMLWIAALTGLASFMYEIAWIRMLSMVLGASTHSFEIMLGAFILGLALGSLFIRKYIDDIKNPIVTLGLIQVSMGLLAALTIPIYNHTFEIMVFVKDALAPTDSGYVLYGISSLVISILVMLPVTFCAGTTLPLVTHIMLKNGAGDKAVGKVYAFNTMGSIVGIVLAAQIIMPVFGLRWVIVLGATIDVVLGLFLLNHFKGFLFNDRRGQAIIASLAGILVAVPFFSLDTTKMSSGVFRHGSIPDGHEVVFHKDGKTSTVAVSQTKGARTVINNGKPDAAIFIDQEVLVAKNTDNSDKSAKLAAALPEPENAEAERRSADEATMVMLGVLPYVYKSDVKTVANIGLGSGLTTHVLLEHSELEKVDTIEIEQAVVEAAEWFRPNVENIFTDDRSQIHIEDAKTFFATSQQKYDVVVSEPPNPWVSGVAGLFTEEFYTSINRYLEDDSVFVQWLHLYEISPELIGTVYLALASKFEHINLYKISSGDMAFVASRSPLTPDYSEPFSQLSMASVLAEVDILTESDIAFRRLGDKNKLDLFFEGLADNANSDYFPILDVGAAKTRYKKQNANAIFQLHGARVLNTLTNNPQISGQAINEDAFVRETTEAIGVRNFFERINALESGQNIDLFSSDIWLKIADHFVLHVQQCASIMEPESREQLTRSLIDKAVRLHAYATNEQFSKVLSYLTKCSDTLTESGTQWLAVNIAWLNGNYELVKEISTNTLEQGTTLSVAADTLLLKMNVVSSIATNNYDNLPELQDKYGIQNSLNLEIKALFRYSERVASQ